MNTEEEGSSVNTRMPKRIEKPISAEKNSSVDGSSEETGKDIHSHDHTVYTKYFGKGEHHEHSVTQIPSEVIRKYAEEIILVEAPITEDLLIKRIVEQFRDGKITANMRSIIEKALVHVQSNRRLEQGNTVYYGEVMPEQYTGCRAPAGIYRRELDVIPLAEIANKLKMLRQSGEKEEEILIRETIRYFGFNRATAKALGIVREAMSFE